MDPHFEGVIFQTHADELAKRLRTDHPPYCVLDVRSSAEYHAGHLPGARNATQKELTLGLPEGTDAGTEFVVSGGGPGAPAIRMASQALRANGARRVVEFQGGMSEWSAYGFDIESEAPA